RGDSVGLDEPALLLLTSGSTGAAKGVPLSHRQIYCRSQGTRQLHGWTSELVSLNWLPLDHVGGLVYFHLGDVDLGTEQLVAWAGWLLEEALGWVGWLER